MRVRASEQSGTVMRMAKMEGNAFDHGAGIEDCR